MRDYWIEMQIDIITAFPELINAPLNESILKRAQNKKLINILIHNLRDWALDRHKTIDDTPYGGGAGMIYKVQPLYDCLKDLNANNESDKIFLTSPRGYKFDQTHAVRLSLLPRIIIICGHYKGVDERIKNFFPIEEISIGDFILSGGEIASLAIVDAIARLLPGVLNDIDSAMTDSFSENLLDCNYYTRPENFRGESIPSVLKTGDHKKISEWRHQKRVEITKNHRPDLYKKYMKEIK